MSERRYNYSVSNLIQFLGKLTEETINTLTNYTSSKNGSAGPDPYFTSKKVFGLNSNNFETFLKTKDLVMVMFYDSIQPSCPWFCKHFNKAAELTQKPGHAYAAVDCDKETEFCMDVDITKLPFYHIYYKGQRLPFFKPDLNEFQYKEMKMWIEGHADTTPVVCKK